MYKIEKQFMKLVLKALYIIITEQRGFNVGKISAKWDYDCSEFLEALGE